MAQLYHTNNVRTQPMIQKFTLMLRGHSNYTFVPTLAELNFAEGLSVSQAQSCLYEEETREQSDTQKWHDLRAQRLSSSKFKDVCARRADFESLAVRQLKKTVQTAAMRHGINTEEEAASAYADSGDCNVFPAAMIPLKTIPGGCWKSSALLRIQSRS